MADFMPKLQQMLLPMKYVNLWQMESHFGRCCNHLIGWLADVIVKVADGKATLGDGWCYCHCGRWNGHIGWNSFNYGRCYCLCGRWNSHWVNCLLYFIYFILSSEPLNRASSHMWGRWYLPIFLFRDGILTLMYIDSFIIIIFYNSKLIVYKNLYKTQTPIHLGVYLQKITFSCTPEEAMLVEVAKACVY